MPHFEHIVIDTPAELSVSALSDRFMPRRLNASTGQVLKANFQYPLCRIDSCHCCAIDVDDAGARLAFSIRSVGSIHATVEPYSLKRPDGSFSIRSVGSIHATTSACRADHLEAPLSVSALSDRFMPLRSMRRRHRQPRCFQYPLCRIDSCHNVRSFGSADRMARMLSVSALSDRFMPLHRMPSALRCHASSVDPFSIRSVGSIHATLCPQAILGRFALSVSALSDRFMPLGSRSCRCIQLHPDLSVSALSDRFMPRICARLPSHRRTWRFSIRSVGSIHATWRYGKQERRPPVSVSALSDRFMPLRRADRPTCP